MSVRITPPAEFGLRPEAPLAPLTTLAIGGNSRWLLELRDPGLLDTAWNWARSQGLPVLFLGAGSNVLFSDAGYDGLVIRNRLRGRERAGNEVRVSGGEDLGETIRWVNRLGLAGMERLYGIPGTVAGAVVGNAGAYGQEIGDRIREVSFWSPEQGVTTLPASDLDFRYRHSRFKERREWFLLSCTLALEAASEPLQPVSDQILATRLAKYPVGLKCPGSFFKNVIADELDPQGLSRIPEDFIFYGKIPAGKLLDEVGARGRRMGGALIASHHANLFVNEEGAASRDMLALARKYSNRVREKFDIELEPEILIVSPNQWR
ncbi:MAG: UDP-N-acetylmuramate dehydrogenase [Acidobacteriota bacterium]|nr:UDP-N-acetylmuramate dehydrogenase [Acidobacteriota bacterium]